MTTQTTRLVIEVTWHDDISRHPATWQWEMGGNPARVIAVLTPEAAREVAEDVPDPYGNRGRGL